MLLCLFDERRRGDPDPAAGSRRRRLARVRARRRRRAGVRLPGDRAVRPGPRRALQPGQAAARPVRPGHRRARSGSGPEVLGHVPDDPDTPSTLDSAAHVPRSLVVDPAVRLDATEPAGRRRYADTVIYEVHVKGFTAAHPDVPPELRGTYAGLGHDAAIAHLLDLGVTAVELLPVHQHVPEAFLPGARPDQLLGLQHDRLLRPARRLLRRGAGRAARAARSPSSRPWSTPCTPPGSRCCSTWCSTTPPRATTRGPTLCHRGLDNAAYYRLDPADPRRYVDTTGCGNSLNAADPLALQMVMDSLRYWLHRDAGRRLPLRPRPDARPRVRRLRPRVGVLRPGLAGPGGVPGQADRRAVGRRPGRQLRRRPLPPAVAGVERQVPRHDARLLAQPRRPARRLRHPLHRVVRPLRRRRAAAHRVGQPDHRARRLHARRPGLLRPQAQRGQRRGQPRRHRRQPLVELRCRGPDRPTPTSSPCAAASSRALLATLLLSFGVPMLLGGDELGRTQQGNNNAYCQDNPITWFDWSARRRGPARLHPAADRVPAGPSGVPAAPVPGRGGGGRTAAGSPRPARP